MARSGKLIKEKRNDCQSQKLFHIVVQVIGKQKHGQLIVLMALSIEKKVVQDVDAGNTAHEEDIQHGLVYFSTNA